MGITKLASKTKKLLSDNSPAILTAIGVTGTITTAYFAAKAAYKSAAILEEAELQKNKDRYLKDEPGPRVKLSSKEKVQLLWSLYVPAVVSGTTTVTCILAANYMGTRQAAALAAAVSVSEKALTEYQAKAKELLGPEQERVIRQEIEADRREKQPPLQVFLGNENVLFLDAHSGRYFQSNKEKIRRAANDIGYQILKSDYATLTDFYDLVGLPPTSSSDEFGWNGEHPLELIFSCHETPDGKPCMAYDFEIVPIRNPWQV